MFDAWYLAWNFFEATSCWQWCWQRMSNRLRDVLTKLVLVISKASSVLVSNQFRCIVRVLFVNEKTRSTVAFERTGNEKRKLNYHLLAVPKHAIRTPGRHTQNR